MSKLIRKFSIFIHIYLQNISKNIIFLYFEILQQGILDYETYILNYQLDNGIIICEFMEGIFQEEARTIFQFITSGNPKT